MKLYDKNILFLSFVLILIVESVSNIINKEFRFLLQIVLTLIPFLKVKIDLSYLRISLILFLLLFFNFFLHLKTNVNYD